MNFFDGICFFSCLSVYLRDFIKKTIIRTENGVESKREVPRLSYSYTTLIELKNQKVCEGFMEMQESDVK